MQSTGTSSADQTKTTNLSSDDAIKNDLLDPSIEVIEVKIADDDVIQTYTVSDSDDNEVVMQADVKDVLIPSVEPDVDPLSGTVDLELDFDEVVSEIKDMPENTAKVSANEGAKSTIIKVQRRNAQ